MKKNNSFSLLQYCVKHDRIVFSCLGLDKNEKEAAKIFDSFLIDISRGNNVFLHAYRLSDISDIVDPQTVISQTDVLLDPYNSYFYLTEAKAKSVYFANDTCCEAQFFFCKKNVKWEEFLATSVFKMRKKLLKSSLLSAVFYVYDHGANFAFESNKIYEEKIFDFFDSLTKLGWQIKKVRKLEYPN